MWNQETLQRAWARDAWILPPKILRRQEGLSFLQLTARSCRGPSAQPIWDQVSIDGVAPAPLP